MSIKVTSTVPTYERNGKEEPVSCRRPISVSSHWNRKVFVILHLTEDETVTVAASDLIAAIKNAQNTSWP